MDPPIVNKRNLTSQASKSGVTSTKNMTNLEQKKSSEKPTTARVGLKKSTYKRNESP
jgi:hypothetical protein